MKLVKGIDRWWDPAYSGEWIVHADIQIPPGQTFASAFHELFARSGDWLLSDMVPTGDVIDVHFKMSVRTRRRGDLRGWPWRARLWAERRLGVG